MEWVVAILVGLLAIVIVPFVAMYARRRWLTGQGGLFDCAYRDSDSGWDLGFARYRGDNLEWFKAFGVALTPARVIRRGLNDYVEQRPASETELDTLFHDSRVVRIRGRRDAHEHMLAMEPQHTTGLMSWLESAPPGSHVLPGSADSPL